MQRKGSTMALQWTPTWEEVVIESHGIRLRVKRDKETKLLACPICGEGDNAIYFFSVEDLIRHILSHTKRIERHQVFVPTKPIEEEGEEEYEEE